MKHVKTNKTGAIVYFDATASGPQILALASNCKSSMKLTNVIKSTASDDTVRRRDMYLDVTEEMYKYVDLTKTVLHKDAKLRRKQVKKAIMTAFYGSKQEPENLFGKGTEDLAAFWLAMENLLPGPMRLMQEMQESWDSSKTYNSWIMPNGSNVHIAIIDKFTGNFSMTVNEKRVEVPLITSVIQKMEKGLSLAANITHSIDAYIKDYVVLRFKNLGLSITTIHDAFGVHPNDVEVLMESYRDALFHVYKTQVLQHILRQVKDEPTYQLPRMDKSIYDVRIRTSKYALS